MNIRYANDMNIENKELLEKAMYIVQEKLFPRYSLSLAFLIKSIYINKMMIIFCVLQT